MNVVMHRTGKRVVSNTDVDDVAVLIRYENVFNAASEIEDTNGDTPALQCEPRSKDDRKIYPLNVIFEFVYHTCALLR